VLIGATVAATGCGSSEPQASSSDRHSVTIAISTATLAPKEEVAVYSVGKAMGYFKREGLKVNIITTDGSTAAVQAVASGSADITPADAGSTLAAAAKGVPVEAVGGLVQHWPWRIAVPPSSTIHNAKDLKSKRIGVISLASGSAPYAKAFVDAAGLSASDVSLVPVGVGAQAESALTSGKVDALALYTQAYTVIENSGAQFRFLDNPPVFNGVRSLTWATRKQNVKQQPKTYGKFLRAAYESLLFSATNPRAAMNMGYKVLPQLLSGHNKQQRIDDDVRTLKTWIESATPKTGPPSSWKRFGYISDQSWKATEQFAQFSGQIKHPMPITKFYTDTLLKTANHFDHGKVIAAAKQAG
jgi:NitT/TauT family transport system substrate-binding protein